jgi:hypothetical protein
MEALGLPTNSVDCVVTSPPYATALPYIDTDRLSLLSVMGLTSPVRSKLEQSLAGSREITRGLKDHFETELHRPNAKDQLPSSVVECIRRIDVANKEDTVGFRRANMAALLWRYFIDMRNNLSQVTHVLKPGGKAFYVVGDSRTKAGNEWVAIETCRHIASIGEMTGLTFKGTLSIDVTTENYKHVKNAITENQILTFEKP